MAFEPQYYPKQQECINSVNQSIKCLRFLLLSKWAKTRRKGQMCDGIIQSEVYDPKDALSARQLLHQEGNLHLCDRRQGRFHPAPRRSVLDTLTATPRSTPRLYEKVPPADSIWMLEPIFAQPRTKPLCKGGSVT
jgi:hypothetical protein